MEMGRVIVANDISEVAIIVKDLGGAKYDTIENCKETYRHAEDIYESQKANVVSVIRANALMRMKEHIMGNAWKENLGRVPQHLVDEWKEALNDIGELDDDGNESRQVRGLMRFAKVIETGKLKGILVPVPNEKQLRRLASLIKNKYRKSADTIELATTYNEVAKAVNDGKVFKSDSDLEDAYNNFKKEPKKTPKKNKPKKGSDPTPEPTMVYVRELFIEEVGEEPEVKSAGKVQSEIMNAFPTVARDLWKTTFKRISLAVHPDQGGTQEMQDILNKFNAMMETLYQAEKMENNHTEWVADYEAWKKDRGYKSDFVPENELEL